MAILCIFFSLLSLILIFAEITLFYSGLNLNPIGLFLKTTDNYILFFIYITIPLVYFTFSTMFAFVKSSIKSYEVCKFNTDSISMLYLSGFMCFICFPLYLNFIQILKLKNPTYLEIILGAESNVMTFANKFFKYYPLILIIFCLFTLFNCFQRIAFTFGFESFETLDDNEQELKSMEGRRLIISDIKQNFDEKKLSMLSMLRFLNKVLIRLPQVLII